MAQRLIRILCPACKKETALLPERKKRVDEVLASVAEKTKNIQKEKEFLPVGCKECAGLGYKGRLGIFEAVFMNEKISDLVSKSSSERDIAEEEASQGTFTMLQDGFVKALTGITSFEELSRVIDIEARN